MTLLGTVHVVDRDELSADERCDFTISAQVEVSTQQPTGTAKWEAPQCDEIGTMVRLTVTLANDGRVHAHFGGDMGPGFKYWREWDGKAEHEYDFKGLGAGEYDETEISFELDSHRGVFSPRVECLRVQYVG